MVVVAAMVAAACGGGDRGLSGGASGDDSLGQNGPPASIPPPGRRAGLLPPGVLVARDTGRQVTEDLGPYPVLLPSGRVVAEGEPIGDSRSLPPRVRPGRYPVHVTLVRQPAGPVEEVALASLLVSDAPTVGWRHVIDISVDAGSAAFTSIEGSDALGRLLRRDEERFSAVRMDAFQAVQANGRLIAAAPIDEKLNLVQFTSGQGDGGYGVYVGLDAAGRATRFVIDFMLLDLAWP